MNTHAKVEERHLELRDKIANWHTDMWVAAQLLANAEAATVAEAVANAVGTIERLTEESQSAGAELDALKRSILDLSHPNMKMLLADKAAAEEHVRELTAAAAGGWLDSFADTKRMDWLKKHALELWFEDTEGGEHQLNYTKDGVRAAIDAAMKDKP